MWTNALSTKRDAGKGGEEYKGVFSISAHDPFWLRQIHCLVNHTNWGKCEVIYTKTLLLPTVDAIENGSWRAVQAV